MTMDDDGTTPRKNAPIERSAGEDLVEGLGLLLQAARKAVDAIDTRPLERLGRRASDRLVSAEVEQLVRKGGRGILSVVSRVAQDMDERLAGTARSGRSHQAETPTSDEPSAKSRGDETP